MTQPTPYTRQFNFTDYAANEPTAPLPGTAVDAELDAAKATLDGVGRSLAQLQRDDGALKNRIVSLDSLSPEVMLALGAGVIWLPRGAWVASTAYAVSDVVSNGGASYVCAAAHASGLVFATDLAAGRWILLYDSAGSTPADGSVTPAKIANGAVTTPAIGFNELDLSGTVRGRGGVQAGTAPLGGLMHAKLDAGNVFSKVERKLADQGAVGQEFIGVSATWRVQMAAASGDLSIYNSVLGGIGTTFTLAGGLYQAGHIRATGFTLPTAGGGIAMSFQANIGYLDSYDYTASLWRLAKIRALEVWLQAGGVDVVKVTATGVSIAGTVARGGLELGYLDVPQNPQNGAYTLVPGDRGRHIYSANVAGQTIVIPTNAAAPFPIGSAVVIVNDGTNPITISTTGITLKFAGSGATGNRTLAANGVATVLKVGTDRWFVSGAGLS